ncbi:MAG: hypothetical protein MR288_01195 [Firmicutes bacterium]|nr:hypothetical protein [Bacillota bacterium]
MQESINKLSTYFGFSIKSNAILFGIDNIVKSRKPVELIVLCSSANEKTIRTVQNKGNKVIQLKNILLSDLVKRDNVKVVAIKNSNLAKAILSFDDMFTELN